MDQAAELPRKCPGLNCENDASTLHCPKCKQMDVDSFFCSQDCFKRSWGEHKVLHKKTGTFNPYPTYPFTGPTRPVYPLSEKRTVPKSIPHPEWSETGIPNYPYVRRNKVDILDEKGIAAMRKVCRLSREVLDEAARACKPGVTTDYIDQVVHDACIARNAYPSPLNYNHFPKSVCTSVNEVICHGIPDARVLQDGDILNIDVSLFHEGYHGDLNETYYVGSAATANPDNVRLIEGTREALEKAIAHVKPDVKIGDFGDIIEKHAKSQNLSVVKTYCGHGVNTLFHGAPNVPHYARNKAVGRCKPGMTFTIEPMICLGNHKDKTWPDNWTAVTSDGLRTAQFEHTLLVTETGVEVLTARLPDSPGGPFKNEVEVNGNGIKEGEVNGNGVK